MATMDAVPILQLNIIALNECPQNFKNLWRHALSEVNMGGQSDDPIIRKGAEITLALLPNMLLRAPSAAEHLMSTRQKMYVIFGRFFEGEFLALVDGIHLSKGESKMKTIPEPFFTRPQKECSLPIDGIVGKKGSKPKWHTFTPQGVYALAA